MTRVSGLFLTPKTMPNNKSVRKIESAANPVGDSLRLLLESIKRFERLYDLIG